jgi:membrane protease YdiL (CAAX protease family)
MPQGLARFKVMSLSRLTEKNLWIVFYTVLAALIVGYYYNSPTVVHHFHTLRFTIYIGLPLLSNLFFLKLPLSQLGLGRPSFSKNAKIYFTAILIIAPILYVAFPLFESYPKNYPQYQDALIPWSQKAERFLIFTLSTLPAWEFLHRGFLLGALKSILGKAKIDENIAVSLSILAVTMSEALYHLVKPDIEAFGMLALSPILSWFAIRTKSIWIPIILHLYIEFLFFLQICHIRN